MNIARFDERSVLDAIISGLVEEGCDLDGLDVQLSLYGPVDLDLLGECLARHRVAMAAAPADDLARAA